MKILLLHNRYFWRGGEDEVVEAERGLLRSQGHEVVDHVLDNRDALSRGRAATARQLWRGAWSEASYHSICALAREARADLVHAHNLWFSLTPSALSACHDAGFPVVLTLHNFRLLCPGGVLLDRHGNPCDICVGRHPWRGVLKRCYHNSFLASAAVARMALVNRRRGTWQRDVDLFIVPSDFCREVFIRGGLPAEKIAVKPNFVADPLKGSEEPAPEPGGTERVLFIGRLSREKGLRTLLAAWPRVEKETGAELRLVGEGPMREELVERAAGLKVSFAGRRPREEIADEVRASLALVLPSECYETFGRALVEAYAVGRPVVVSRLGGPAELVKGERTGLLFEPGDAGDLAAKLTSLLSGDDLRRRMGQEARRKYLAEFTPEKNYGRLMECYRQAMETHKSCGRA